MAADSTQQPRADRAAATAPAEVYAFQRHTHINMGQDWYHEQPPDDTLLAIYAAWDGRIGSCSGQLTRWMYIGLGDGGEVWSQCSGEDDGSCYGPEAIDVCGPAGPVLSDEDFEYVVADTLDELLHWNEWEWHTRMTDLTPRYPALHIECLRAVCTEYDVDDAYDSDDARRYDSDVGGDKDSIAHELRWLRAHALYVTRLKAQHGADCPVRLWKP